MRRLVCASLIVHGYDAVEATTVGEAIAAAKRGPLAAVVLDLTLGQNESGLEFLAWLRERSRYQGTPVLILTGRTAIEADDQQIIQQYRAFVFYKPLSMAVLVDFLTRLTATTASPSTER